MDTVRSSEFRDAGSSVDLLDVERLREDFPILSARVHGKPLVYLDNAATTQKPEAVIRSIERYYREENSNVHRGVHLLSQLATDRFEKARHTVKRFLNARSSKEIVFVRGATEGINLVAQSFGRARLRPGDEIVISAMEHHSNIVPWQLLCAQTEAVLRILPMNQRGELELEKLDDLLTERTRIVGLVHLSNALGTINPVSEIISRAHDCGAAVVLDAAQSVPHLPVDVRALDVDFLVFSGHKVFGPTGIGVLFGKEALLEEMPPYQGGGDMISAVTFEKTTYNELPYKFEAGTPNIAGAVGLGAALEYVSRIGIEKISTYEKELAAYAEEALLQLPEVRLFGQARRRASVLSFGLDGVHPHDIGTILDHEGVAIRTGHHCAQPVMDFFGVPATARASLAFYNTRDEIDTLTAALKKVLKVFG